MPKLLDYISEVLFKQSRVWLTDETFFCPWIILKERDIAEQRNRSFMTTE